MISRTGLDGYCCAPAVAAVSATNASKALRSACDCLMSPPPKMRVAGLLALAIQKRLHHAPRLVGAACFDTRPDASPDRVGDRHALPVANERFLQSDRARTSKQYRADHFFDGGIELG